MSKPHPGAKALKLRFPMSFMQIYKLATTHNMITSTFNPHYIESAQKWTQCDYHRFLRHNGPWNLSEQHTRRRIFWQNISFKISVRLVSYFVYQTGNGWNHGNCSSGKILIFEYHRGILFFFPFMCFAKVVYFFAEKKIDTENWKQHVFSQVFLWFFLFWGKNTKSLPQK